MMWAPCLLDIVCGLAPSVRDSWPIMAIQAFVDDSVAEGEVLILAGYLASAKYWSLFSDEWQQRLDMKPRMSKFHMVDVNRDSELQMERVRQFYRVIEDHVAAGVAVAVDLKQLRALPPDPYIPPQALNPYMVGIKAIMDNLIQQQQLLGIDSPVDFIFDKRSERRLVERAFSTYQDSMPPEHAHLVGRTPRFEDDEKFLPLQAADMLAWWMRRHWLQHRSIVIENLRFPWGENGITMIVLDVSGRDLHEDYEFMKEEYRKQRGIPVVKVTFRYDV